jgi:hypothetical protein
MPFFPNLALHQTPKTSRLLSLVSLSLAFKTENGWKLLFI